MPTGDKITRIYSNFRGVDFRGDEINLIRSPDSLNVWKDYKETESIRTRPKLELVTSFEDKVYGVFFYTVDNVDMMLVHSGDKLYKVVDGITTLIYSGTPVSDDGIVSNMLSEKTSYSFIFNDIFYFKDGHNYLQYDGNEVKHVVGYVPTTSISRTPSGGGTMYEDVNLLSAWRKNSFVGDGTSTEYYLDTQNIYNPFDFNTPLAEIRRYLRVTINGGDSFDTGYTCDWDFETGKVTITPAPPAPDTDGQDNVVIQFKVRNAEMEHQGEISRCTLLQVFDNRVFFTGNPAFPNKIWHSSLNDPTYCSDLDYYIEGLDTTNITGIVAGNDALWVFKEPSQANTAIYYHKPTNDSEYGKIYPNIHSSISTGCVGKAINFNDDIVFFSERGMEGINGDVTTEQVIAHRSSLIDRKLIAEPNYKDMVLAEWEGYLIVFIGNKAYLADGRAMFTNGNHNEYEWFYWELSKSVTCATVNEGVLYVGTEDGIYSFTDFESSVESYWVTPKDKFNNPHFLKATNKRGCVVEALGDVSVYVKTEKTDYELISEHKDIKDYFTCRIKRKKFKDIQLKFHSMSRFSLETATLECFIGGYIKR